MSFHDNFLSLNYYTYLAILACYRCFESESLRARTLQLEKHSKVFRIKLKHGTSIFFNQKRRQRNKTRNLIEFLLKSDLASQPSFPAILIYSILGTRGIRRRRQTNLIFDISRKLCGIYLAVPSTQSFCCFREARRLFKFIYFNVFKVKFHTIFCVVFRRLPWENEKKCLRIQIIPQMRDSFPI